MDPLESERMNAVLLDTDMPFPMTEASLVVLALGFLLVALWLRYLYR